MATNPTPEVNLSRMVIDSSQRNVEKINIALNILRDAAKAAEAKGNNAALDLAIRTAMALTVDPAVSPYEAPLGVAFSAWLESIQEAPDLYDAPVEDLDGEEDTVFCEECGVYIPDVEGGSLANQWHEEFCSLFDPEAA
jgi:hypothetical protein